MPVAARAAETFTRLHHTPPHGVWSAPGRVNLIGEHTDYNDGFVLPFALPHRTAVAAAPRTDGTLTITTVGDDGRPQRAAPLRVSALSPGNVRGWVAYPAGVAWVLRQQGVASVQDSVRSGADLVICGEVPAGAGLSSSAALECAVALALLGLAGQEVSPDGYSSTASSPTSTSTTGPGSTDPGATDPGPGRIDVARWAHLAENDFVGAPTGVLDQMASMCCTDAHALFLDVRSGAAQQVRFDATSEGLQILVVDTRANHSHSESGYGDRRRGCEEAARLLGVPALRDVPMSELDDTLRSLPERLQPLVRHVVTENDRVLTTIALLRANRLHDIGRWLTSSHESLRDDYRVSAPELDVAVNAALEAGALGARMTGGGFGGSAIALVREDRRAVVERSVVAAFGRRSFSPPRLFTAAPAAGAGRDR